MFQLCALALTFSSPTQHVTRPLSLQGGPLSLQGGPLSRQGMPHMLLPPEAVSGLASTIEVLSVPLILLANNGADVLTTDLPGVFAIAGFTPRIVAVLVVAFGVVGGAATLGFSQLSMQLSEVDRRTPPNPIYAATCHRLHLPPPPSPPLNPAPANQSRCLYSYDV